MSVALPGVSPLRSVGPVAIQAACDPPYPARPMKRPHAVRHRSGLSNGTRGLCRASPIGRWRFR